MPARYTIWDWAREVERPLVWIARQTGKSSTAVYLYRNGTRNPPDDWKRKAERLAGRKLDWPNGKER